MKLNTYQKTALTTVFATLVLILIGGLVRAAGAGLGCPDWPKCFGMWIPPTSAEGLPSQFDASLFNPIHTWLEYVNRLVGVLIGLLIMATFALSLRYRKTDPSVTVASALAFFLVLVQGWLGGQVVKSGLQSGMITIHMVLAMIILNTLLYAAFKATREKLAVKLSNENKRMLLGLGGFILFFTMLQLVLGTQVREEIDAVKNAAIVPPRDMWIEFTSWLYDVHRSFSWLIVILTAVLVYLLRSRNIQGVVRKTGVAIALLVLFQMLIGFGMERLGMPGTLQVLHLVSVAVLVCAEFLILLMAWFSDAEMLAEKKLK
ncbi:MAG TPA: COX15/CtaA family protein [Balneolaceae bacterium]|nr:COX15/CtaA family protein [Balneolaceae bacterium]